MKRLGVLLIFALAVPPAASATTYYVATNGDDSWPGTDESQPWATIQKAADTMVAGDTVLIRGGVYSEEVFPQNAGDPGNEITYRAYPGEEVIIEGNPGPLGSTITLETFKPLRYLRFENLTLRNAGAYNFYAKASLMGPKQHITLDGLTIEGAYLGILWRTGVTDSEIRNCEMSGNQYNIYLDRSNTDILIDGNHFADTQYHIPQDIFSNSINLYGEPGEKNRRVTITNNHVHHSVLTGIQVFHADDVIVRNNHSHDNGATGIQIESKPEFGATLRVVVEDNLCEDNSRTLPAETGIWIDDSDDVIVHNNVIRGN